MMAVRRDKPPEPVVITDLPAWATGPDDDLFRTHYRALYDRVMSGRPSRADLALFRAVRRRALRPTNRKD